MQRILMKILVFICIIQIANSTENNKLAKPKTESKWTPTRFLANCLKGVLRFSFFAAVSALFYFASLLAYYSNNPKSLGAGLEIVKENYYRVSGLLVSNLFDFGESRTYFAIFISVILLGIAETIVVQNRAPPKVFPVLTEIHQKNRTNEQDKPAESETNAEKNSPKKDPDTTTTPGNVSQEAFASPEDNTENPNPSPSQNGNWAAYLAIGLACPLGAVGLACIYCKFCQKKPTTSAGSDIENVQTPENNTAGPEN